MHHAHLAWGARVIPTLWSDLYRKMKVTIFALLISCLNIILMSLCRMLGPYKHLEMILVNDIVSKIGPTNLGF